MGLSNLIRRLRGEPTPPPQPVEDDEDIFLTDTYIMALMELLRLSDEEDDTANFNIQEELIDDTQ